MTKHNEIKYINNYIGGEIITPTNGKYFDNYEPATGKVYSQIADSNTDDVELAVAAAEKAFPIWSKTSLEDRHRIMMKISYLIEENLTELALAESMDNGKPVKLAERVDIPRAVSNFQFFATAILHYNSAASETIGTAINYTLNQPIGIVGCISPWNLPLYLFTWKIAPALAAGNCVIAKPSEITPLTAFMLSEICIEAGLPAGVLNIIHGNGAGVGEPIVTHPKIKAISFTGGTSTGARIASLAAPKFKKLSLELGGKNPNIIFADCNYDEMLKTTLLSSFSNQGQICLCGSRIFVEKSIYEKFKKDFIEAVSKFKIGDPQESDTRIGALVSQSHYEKILYYIELAKSEGGTILTGGNAVKVEGRCENGWFVEPTIIEGLAFDCKTNQEEIFGPVVTITPFDTEDEVLMYANSTEYGLASTVWTENISKANRIASNLQTGIVWVNCWLLRDLRTPFGGVKSSGVGREGGFYALDFFTEKKNVCIKY
jgi:aminomuconate-semialdehyde/2-hydroxymuconate-6-semialdehyde dehydrogenase